MNSFVRSGRPGRLPAPAPLRSGRARLRHPAPRAMNSPAASRPRPCDAIRRRPVEMGSRLGVLVIFLSGGLLARRPLPSAGSLGSVPPRHRYYETLRIPVARPAALRCLRTGGIPVVSEFRSRGRRMRRPRAWSWSPGTSRRELAEKTTGPPRFLGNPRERALFSDPGGIACARPSRRRDAAFRFDDNVGSREFLHFGAQSHGPFTGCLRFVTPVTRTPRKTRFRLLAKLYRTGVDTPQGSIERFPRYNRFLLSQAFLAHHHLKYRHGLQAAPPESCHEAS
jgi:hypothetical protein